MFRQRIIRVESSGCRVLCIGILGCSGSENFSGGLKARPCTTMGYTGYLVNGGKPGQYNP